MKTGRTEIQTLPHRWSVKSAALAVASLAIVTAACATDHGEDVGRIRLAASIFQGNTWFPMGPAPLQGGQLYGAAAPVGGNNVAGRATVIAANQFNTQEVYVGTAGGGLWHTS